MSYSPADQVAVTLVIHSGKIRAAKSALDLAERFKQHKDFWMRVYETIQNHFVDTDAKSGCYAQ